MLIVVLCDDFYQAIDRFYQFLDCLVEVAHEDIREIYDGAYCVETDADLKYVFVDYRMASLFNSGPVDFIDEREFFEDLSELYYRYY